jgi:phosphoribosylanthranilate isomerase
LSTKSFQEKLSAREVAVKICGVTALEEAGAIIELGADCLGFNFWPQSKRFLGKVSENPWVRDLDVCKVGVFVNSPAGDILELWRDKWIDMAQLHGEETPEDCQALMEAGVPVIKAIGIKDEQSLARLPGYGTETVLLDAYAPVEKGGTGKSFNWDLAREAVETYSDRNIILAGGLNAGNVGAAVAAVRPAAVDVASGVEEAPGHKDLNMVRQFIEEARKA